MKLRGILKKCREVCIDHECTKTISCQECMNQSVTQAEQEILKLLLSWKDIDKELYLLFNFEPELRKSIAKAISDKMKEKL